MTTCITERNQRFPIELKNFCQLEIDIMVPDNFRHKFFGLRIICNANPKSFFRTLVTYIQRCFSAANVLIFLARFFALDYKKNMLEEDSNLYSYSNF